MSPAPLVSVVVPAYNLGRFLGDSIRSVLSQTLTDLECIVVDDGSTDDTLAVARSFTDPRVRVIEKENGGTVAEARNVGVAAARGEMIAFLDADDWWLPEKLQRQVGLMETSPDLGFVYCGYAICNEDLTVRTIVDAEPAPADLRAQILTEANGIGFSSTALVRSRILDDVGSFNTILSVSEDIDLADRIAQRHAVGTVPECLTLYRLHGSQGHRRLDRYEHDLNWILDDRFGADGRLDRASWRRGRANLYTRLALYEGIYGDRSRALPHVLTALRHQPSRLLVLPTQSALRRVRRRLRLVRERRALEERVRAVYLRQLEST